MNAPQALTSNEAIVMDEIAAAALAGKSCPSNDYLAGLTDLSLAMPPKILKQLESKGLIVVTRFQSGREVFVPALGKSTKPHSGSRQKHWRDLPRAERPTPRYIVSHPRDIAPSEPEILPPAVVRDPCPVCAARADVGCEHQAASGTSPVILVSSEIDEFDGRRLKGLLKSLGLAHFRDWLSEMAAENARRIPCQHCSLMILPETMERHLAVVHEEDEA